MGLSIGQSHQYETEGLWACVLWDDLEGYVWWLEHEEPWTEDGSYDARVKVARANNQEARKFMRKRSRKYRHLVRRNGDIPEHIAMQNLRDQYAHTILLDWEGVEFPDGTTPDYTPEKGAEAFEADEAFFDLIINIAGTTEAFRSEDIAEEAESVGNGSNGRSGGGNTSTSSGTQE